MHDDTSPLWLLLQLDSGTAAFLGLPERLPVPESHAGSLLGGSRPTLAALAAGLEAAMEMDPQLASDPALLRFLRRWPRYADLERYLRFGNATFAHRLARDLCADDPTDPPALAALALLSAQEGDWDAALERLAPLRERTPDHPATRLQVALSLAGAGRRDESLAELAKLRHSRLQPMARLWTYEVRRTPPELLAERMQAAFRTRWGSDPFGGTEGAAQEDVAFPGNPEVLFQQSFDPGLAPDLAARERLLRQAQDGDPDHEGAAAALGSLLRLSGRAEEAREMLVEFLSRHPGEAGVRAALGETLEQAGEVISAQEAYRKTFAPPWTGLAGPAYLTAGLGLLRLGERDALRTRLEDALRALPAEPLLYELSARLLESTEGEDAAEHALRRGVKACGPRPSLLYSLGDLLRRRGRRHEAEGLMKALVKRHPASAWGHRGLGDLLVEADPAAALGHYARAVERDPVTPIPGVDYLQGVKALREGDIAQARHRLERAVAYDPGNARFWCDLGAAYFHEQRLDDALRATERAVGLRPQEPGFLHNLAVYHRERFRRDPWRHLLDGWTAWRLRRVAERSTDAEWRRRLWRPEGPGSKGGDPPREAPPDA